MAPEAFYYDDVNMTRAIGRLAMDFYRFGFSKCTQICDTTVKIALTVRFMVQYLK